MCFCNATPEPIAATLTIKWQRNGHDILNGPHANKTGGKNCDDNTCVSWSILELFHTQPADSGTYVCEVINYDARVTATKSANLTVEGIG